MALDVFRTHVEQAHRRTFEPEHGAREGFAHHREIDELVGVAFDVGADVEDHALPAFGRPQRRDRRPRNAFDHPELIHRHRHQRAGVAGGDDDFGLAVLHGFDGAPHAGLASAAKRQARLLIHAHIRLGVTHADVLGELGAALSQQFFDSRFVAVHDELYAGMTLYRTSERGYDNGRAGIAAHRVNRNRQFAGHDRNCPSQ